MADWTPTFVVGIDFGMTCTGVAFSSADYAWSDPRVIQKWPDRRGGLFDKYPSRVGYDGSGNLRDWGQCNKTDMSLRVEREFKLYLDPNFQDDFASSPTHERAVEYYKDYMRKVREHIEEFFSNTVGGWNQQKVEYVFSIPTTWTNPALTDKLKGWLALAGFRNSANRRVVVSQTEAEAAAVYAAKHYKKGDVIMVVDAGGATTGKDVNLLEVKERDPVTRLFALGKAEGEDIGSVGIDTMTKELIAIRLEQMGIQSDDDLTYLAEDMMERSNFETSKCEFNGNSEDMDIHLDIPGYIGREVVIKASELKALFDLLIGKLISVLNEQISSLARQHPQTKLRYIVLSGGLGSSKYVQQRLRGTFCYGVSSFPNASNVEILKATEPQLVVVKGLVMERAQALKSGRGIYSGKRSRVSYGVLCRLDYDPSKHTGQPVIKDEVTGEKKVENQIDWLIKQGEIVDDKGLKRKYGLKVSQGDEYNDFHAYLVMSRLPADRLPSSKRPETVEDICVVTGQFIGDDFKNSKLKQRRLHRPNKHYAMEFYLKVLVGSTDLAFEFTSLDGKKYSTEEAKVDVEWDIVPVDRPPTFRGGTRIYPVQTDDTKRELSRGLPMLRRRQGS